MFTNVTVELSAIFKVGTAHLMNLMLDSYTEKTEISYN